MKKNLILIAGSPATGKSQVVKIIKEMFDSTVLIAPDDIKEKYAELNGFSNLNEKVQLEKKVWNNYYSLLQQYMETNQYIIISEYPFSTKQYHCLKNMSKIYDYNVLTIRLVADFETLWRRRYKRDREPNRHLSHIVKSYHLDDELADRYQADNHITKIAFKEIIEDRKYNEFELGKLLEVDMTDFSKVDYISIINFIDHNIKKID